MCATRLPSAQSLKIGSSLVYSCLDLSHALSYAVHINVAKLEPEGVSRACQFLPLRLSASQTMLR